MKNMILERASVQFSCSVVSDSLRPMNCSTPGLPVHHQLPEFTQTHVHNQVSDAIQTSHPLSSPSPPAPNPSQHKGLFQWVNSSHEVAKVLEFQILHQSFQWTPRTDLLQNGLVGSPCSPRDSQESSPTPQFKSIIKGIGMYLILDLVSTFKHYSAFEKQPSTQIFMKKWNYIILQPPKGFSASHNSKEKKFLLPVSCMDVKAGDPVALLDQRCFSNKMWHWLSKGSQAVSGRNSNTTSTRFPI